MADWSRVCGFEPARHHQLIINRLEALVRGDIYRLMITLPPGSAKSTYSSMLFPPWFLAQQPNSRILTASHTTDLAEHFGRQARNLINEHSKILGYELRKDSQAASSWATTNGSEYRCAGVGKAIAGFRADLGLIDDPVGSREDAYSAVIQARNYNWFKTDFRTRLKPNAKIVLIQTRWHELDLAGCILKDEANEWEVINIPMLAGPNDPLGRAPGELLWNNYFNERLLRDAQKDAMVFSALYQGDPTPQDGDYFKREWIEAAAYHPSELPPLSEMRIYATSDHAISETEYADFTVMLVWGICKNGYAWLLPDFFWDRVDSLKMVNEMIRLMQKYRPVTWWAENEKITKSIGPFLRRAMRESNTFCYVDPITPSRDKQTRAQSIRGRMAAGMVRLPRFHPRYPELLGQFLKFPAGANDDVVDASAYLGLGLDRISVGSSPKPPKPEIFESPPITLKWVKRNVRMQEVERQIALRN